MAESPANPRQRTAVVAGATGLVGRELLTLLLRDRRTSSVIALSRRPLTRRHGKLTVVDAAFDRLADVLAVATAQGRPIDVFCCLGTTIAAAGSEDAFRRVDHGFVVALARWAQQVAARRMIVISALGADPASRVFYNRVKGETENDLRALQLPSLVIVRPSLLLGKRDEFRPGERLAQALTTPLRGLIPARVRPIKAADVAQAMLDVANETTPPAVVDSKAMQGAAERSSPRPR